MPTIKDLRRARDMTQQELAQILDCTQKDISRWERGEIKPSADTLRKIAEAFDLSMDEVTPSPRKLKLRDVLTPEGAKETTPAERRLMLKQLQVREYSQWGRFRDTFSRLCEYIPTEWYLLYSAEHIAEVIDLIAKSYGDGKKA